MKFFIPIILCCSLLSQAQTTYHINPDIPLSTVNGNTYVPGDSILFQRGGDWSGTLTITDNGAHSNPIYIGAYGSGNKPIIGGRVAWPGWNNTSNWVAVSGRPNVWRFVGSYTNTQDKTHRIWLNGVEYPRARDSSEISTRYRASYLSETYIFWVYAPSNPATYYTSIEYPGEQTGTINLYGVNHITIEDLDVRGSIGGTIDMSNARHIEIRRCDVGRDAGHIGIRSMNLMDSVTIASCTINSGDTCKDYFQFQHGLQDGIAMNAGTHNYTIWNNTVANWGHSDIEFTSALQDNTSKTKGGYTMSNVSIMYNYLTGAGVDYVRPAGFDVGSTHLTTNIRFRYNYCDSFTVRCQVETAGMDFSYNILKNFRNLGITGASVENTGQAIMVTGYSGTNPKNMTIVGNTIENTDEAGITMATADGYNGVSGNIVENNLLINCAMAPMYDYVDAHIALLLSYPWETNTFRNNLVYKSGTTNFFYDARRSTGQQWMSVAGFNAANGTSIGTVSGNISTAPLTAGGVTYYTGSGYTVGAGWEQLPTSTSTWPDNVTLTTQPATWNIGSFAYAVPVVPGNKFVLKAGGKVTLKTGR
ncbi:MAG TPA: hypothetical protein VFT06_00270 [Flavisolibacter sp.]|nr:hypothetical protein [Flavisolibacter sp.]